MKPIQLWPAPAQGRATGSGSRLRGKKFSTQIYRKKFWKLTKDNFTFLKEYRYLFSLSICVTIVIIWLKLLELPQLCHLRTLKSQSNRPEPEPAPFHRLQQKSPAPAPQHCLHLNVWLLGSATLSRTNHSWSMSHVCSPCCRCASTFWTISSPVGRAPTATSSALSPGRSWVLVFSVAGQYSWRKTVTRSEQSDVIKILPTSPRITAC